MADRRVTHSGKDKDGDILRLCNPGQSWSPREKHDAINDIRGRMHSYYVDIPGTGRVDIKVIPGTTGDYLRTDPDHTSRNNLDDLPEC